VVDNPATPTKEKNHRTAGVVVFSFRRLSNACICKAEWTGKQREAFGFSLLGHPHTGITRSFASSNPATPTTEKRNRQLINWLRFFIPESSPKIPPFLDFLHWLVYYPS